MSDHLVELEVQGSESRFWVFCRTKTIKSVATLIAMFVSSTPKRKRPITTQMAMEVYQHVRRDRLNAAMAQITEAIDG